MSEDDLPATELRDQPRITNRVIMASARLCVLHPGVGQAP